MKKILLAVTTFFFVLLDMWDSPHEACFACIDMSTPPKLLVTTRIKGILQEATEVEHALLGLQESVGLLAGVAEIDTAQTPPACLAIAQLCGRLPLYPGIVGKLVRCWVCPFLE